MFFLFLVFFVKDRGLIILSFAGVVAVLVVWLLRLRLGKGFSIRWTRRVEGGWSNCSPFPLLLDSWALVGMHWVDYSINVFMDIPLV